MTRRMRPDERGVVSIEVVLLTPLVLLVALFVLQLGVVAWTASQTAEAARMAARANSLGRNAPAAAQEALPGALTVKSIQVGHDSVRLRVTVPRVAPLPEFTVQREVSMPRTR